jgi:hypothetical protein
MKQVLKEAEDRDPLRDPKQASQKDWYKSGAKVKEQLLFYRNLPMHVVFVAQERSVDDDEGETFYVPALSPAPRATACGCVDFIGHIFNKEVRGVNKKTKKEIKKWRTLMHVGPSETYLTKDRSLVLPRIMVSPTIPQLITAAAHIEEN